MIPVTGDPAADELLEKDPLALVIGMLLDQQVPMEWAFRGPYNLRERLGFLDATKIAAMGEPAVEAVFREKPALHRYPGAMGRRVHALCELIVERYGGDASRIWADAETGQELLGRVMELPGFGKEKAKIFVALLAKRVGVRPPGWEEATAPFSDDTPRSVADVDSPESLARVREWKKAQKAAGKSKAD
jgi:uncharacterized HhH-GPD family protein